MSDSSGSKHRASRACAACQKYKRRCDKVLPSCSLCVRLQRSCDYTNRQSEGDLKTRIQELEALVACHVGTLSPKSISASSSRDHGIASQYSFSSFYPAALRFQKLFLDTDILSRPDAAPPPSGDMIPATVLQHLGDHAQRAVILSRYFSTVHKWMPVVSKIRLSALADTEFSGRPRADFGLLLLAMKLINEVPQDSSSAVRDSLYLSTKEFSAALDIAGVYSLLRLQANLILAVYEMGHGIFPAAYTSIGGCVALAMALGIHHKGAPQILEPPRTWMEWEERQRVWWMVVILERYVASVGENRPLLSADPKTSSHLPVDDEAWDNGQSLPPERLILSSSKQLSASPFARLAQASHLLGEVIKHCNDDSENLQDVQKAVEMLSQATYSFLEVISKDRENAMHFYSAIGVSLSALLKLGDQHSCDSFVEYNSKTFDMADLTVAREIAFRCQELIKESIDKVLTFIEILNEMMEGQDSELGLSGLAPWFLDSIYQAMANLSYLFSTTPAGDLSGYGVKKAMCVDIFRKVNQRWKVAGAYLEALDLVEVELKANQY